MRLRIGNYGIHSDSTCFTFVKYVVITGQKTKGREAKKENIGKEREQAIGYYAKMQDALKAWLQQELLDSDEMSLEQLVEFIDELDSKIEGIKQ